MKYIHVFLILIIVNCNTVVKNNDLEKINSFTIKLDSFLNMIYVPESGLVKTSISATPLILAYNSIKASVIINGEKIKIPVLYEKKLGKGTVYIKKEERAAYIKSNKEIFFHEKYFLRLSRYNPGRNFINDTFNQKIDGQVLDIELISIEKYINE